MERQKEKKGGFNLWATLLFLVVVARVFQPLFHHHEEFFSEDNSYCVLCMIMHAEALPIETPHVDPEEHLRAEILPEPCYSLCTSPIYTYKQARAPTQFFCLI